MPDNCDTFKKISALSALFIAGATFWGFLITYYNEVGILKYYGVSSRFIKLDIHIFAMSSRSFVVLFVVGLICYIFYQLLSCGLNKNQDVKLNSKYELIHCLLLSLTVIFFIIIGYKYLMEYTNIYGMIAFFLKLLLFLVYFYWVSDKYSKFRMITVLLIVFVLYLGGIESSYTKGFDFCRRNGDYHIINEDTSKVVILSNNEFVLWSDYNKEDSTLDGSFKLTYFSSDTSMHLRQIELGPIKRRK